MLKQWYNDNPSRLLNGLIYSYRDDNNLNTHQKESLTGTFSLREPILAFSEQYKTIYDKDGKYLSAEPIEGTRKRNDLPPLYIQWKEDYRKRFCR